MRDRFKAWSENSLKAFDEKGAETRSMLRLKRETNWVLQSNLISKHGVFEASRRATQGEASLRHRRKVEVAEGGTSAKGC